MLELFEKSPATPLGSAALLVLQHFSDSRVADAIVAMYPRLSVELRQRARSALCSRPTWSASLLDAVDEGRIAQTDLGFEQLRQIVALKDVALRTLPIGLLFFDSTQGRETQLLMAASVMTMAPLVLLFVVGQRFFVQGIQLGAVKG